MAWLVPAWQDIAGKNAPYGHKKHFLFVESFPLGLIFFFFFKPGSGPPEGVFSKEQALYIVHVSALKAPLFQKKKNQTSFSALGNALGGFGGKVGNSWVLGGTSGSGGGRLKSESGG